MFESAKRSLGAKVIIAVVVVLSAFVAGLIYIDTESETKYILEVYRQNAKVLASTIEKGLIPAMKEGRNQDVQKILDDVGTQEEIVSVRIFDEKGGIIRSTNRGDIGGMVDEKTLEIYKSGNGGEASGEYNTQVFTFLKPINNSPECYGCHPKSKKVNGILCVNISVGKAYDEIKNNNLLMIKWGILAVLCVTLSEVFLLRHLVTQRVRKLRGAMRKVEKGEEFQLDLDYEDELGELGQVFKGMIGHIAELNAKAVESERESVRHQEDQKARSMLSAVIEGIPDGVAIINRDMTLVQINPMHRAIFPTAKVGEPCYFCIHQRDGVCPHCGVVKVFEDGKIHDHHSTVNLPDGTVKVVHSISAPIRGEGGEIVNAVEVVRDVTERVNLEREIKEKSWELERANKKLAKMAVTDGLTMLFNRRFFQDSLTKEFRRLARHRALPLLSVAMIDIDYFKNLNDTYGHQAGDFVLREIGKLLKTCMRLTDMVARYGGEEFVIIMPETDTGGTVVVAERVRRSVEEAVFKYREHTLKVTVSIGLASFPMEGIRTEEDLVKAADTALYKAKEQGRNRVVVI